MRFRYLLLVISTTGGMEISNSLKRPPSLIVQRKSKASFPPVNVEKERWASSYFGGRGANNIGSGISDAGNSLGDGIENAGKSLGDGISELGDGLKLIAVAMVLVAIIIKMF